MENSLKGKPSVHSLSNSEIYFWIKLDNQNIPWRFLPCLVLPPWQNQSKSKNIKRSSPWKFAILVSPLLFVVEYINYCITSGPFRQCTPLPTGGTKSWSYILGSPLGRNSHVILHVLGAGVKPGLISFYVLDFLLYLNFYLKQFFLKNKLISDKENNSSHELLTEQDTGLGEVTSFILTRL